MLVMKKQQNAKGTSGMKEWLKAQGISYRRLAASMGSSAATVCKKLNGETPWQQRDLLFFMTSLDFLPILFLVFQLMLKKRRFCDGWWNLRAA